MQWRKMYEYNNSRFICGGKRYGQTVEFIAEKFGTDSQNAKRKSLRMFMFTKIMQIERKILSLLEYFAVIQPIL